MYSAAFSESEDWILTVSEDGHARVYASQAGGEPRYELPATDLGLRSGGFGRQDKLLLTAGEDAVARVWDAGQAVAWWDARGKGAKQLEPLATLRGHGRRINSAVFNPAGDTVATASADGTVILWRVTPPALEEAPGGRFSVEQAEGLTLLCLREKDLGDDLLPDLGIKREEARTNYDACKERKKQQAK
jgi:WD40 repeat protein